MFRNVESRSMLLKAVEIRSFSWPPLTKSISVLFFFWYIWSRMFIWLFFCLPQEQKLSCFLKHRFFGWRPKLYSLIVWIGMLALGTYICFKLPIFEEPNTYSLTFFWKWIHSWYQALICFDLIGSKVHLIFLKEEKDLIISENLNRG